MNEEQVKKMIADDFDNLINKRLDSAIIFKYISNLEKENLKLKEQYCERTDCSGRLGNSKKVEELQQENKQLRLQLEVSDKARKKAIEVIKEHNERAGKLYYKYDNKYLLSEIKEDLLNILDIDKGE